MSDQLPPGTQSPQASSSPDIAALRHLARLALAKVPETRAALVVRLKQQLEQGTYQIDPQRIAEQMLSR